MLCGSWSIVKHVAEQPRLRVIHPLNCRCWECDECAPKRLKQLRAIALSGNPDRFITLTWRAAHAALTPEQAREQIARAWNVALHRLRRRYKKRIEYFVVVETTKSGWPHLHILLRGPWIDQAYLSKVMKELIDAPIVDIRKIDNKGRAVAYVSKYISKSPARFGKMRTWWRSRGYSTARSDDMRRGWLKWDRVEVVREDARTIIGRWFGRGAAIVATDGMKTMVLMPQGP